MNTEKHDDKIYKMELLDLFRRVDSVLQKNGIRYYAIYGTCLGAVREHGIIPWDNDVDIAVWREDFQNALCLLNESEMQLFSEVVGGASFQGRVFHRIDENSNLERKRAYLDVFVIDYAQESKILFKFNVLWYVGVRRIIERRTHKLTNEHPVLYAIADVAALPFRVFTTNALLRLADWIYIRRRSSKLIKLTGNGNRKRYSKAAFSSVLRVPFEDAMICIPVGYEEHLAISYGNWRIPPAPAERASCAYDRTGSVWNVPSPEPSQRPLLVRSTAIK